MALPPRKKHKEEDDMKDPADGATMTGLIRFSYTHRKIRRAANKGGLVGIPVRFSVIFPIVDEGVVMASTHVLSMYVPRGE